MVGLKSCHLICLSLSKQTCVVPPLRSACDVWLPVERASESLIVNYSAMPKPLFSNHKAMRDIPTTAAVPMPALVCLRLSGLESTCSDPLGEPLGFGGAPVHTGMSFLLYLFVERKSKSYLFLCSYVCGERMQTSTRNYTQMYTCTLVNTCGVLIAGWMRPVSRHMEGFIMWPNSKQQFIRGHDSASCLPV